jgi:hypothetical protein
MRTGLSNRGRLVRWAMATVALAITNLAFPQNAPTDPSAPAIEKAAREWSSSTNTFVEGSLPPIMTNSALQFRHIYCYKGNDEPTRSGCKTLLNTPERLRDAVFSYLNQFSSAQQVITTFYAMLATAIQKTSQASGWSPVETRRFWLLEIPQQYYGDIFDVRSAPIPLGTPKRLLLAAGAYTFLVKQGGTPRTVITASWLQSMPVPTIAFRPSGMNERWDSSSPGAPILIDPVANFYCPDWVDVSRDIQRRNRGRDEVFQGAIAAVSQARALELHVDSREATCGENCRQMLAAFFVEAIAAWRTGCKDCDPWLLSVVKFNKDVYADSQLIDALNLSRSVKQPLTNLMDKTSRGSYNGLQDTSILSRALLPNSGRAITGYRNITSDSTLKAGFCATDITGGMRGLLCSDERCADCLVTSVTVLNSYTSCGRDDDIIACGVPDKGIELNGAAFKFSDPVPGPAISAAGHTPELSFGRGSRSVSLKYVFAHEVGHYFGLPHVGDPRSPAGVSNILSPTYSPRGYCVTQSDLTMLDRASRTSWSARLKDCSGLRYAGAIGR